MAHHPGDGQEQQPSTCFALLRDAVRNSDQLTAMISNYSTSYNTVNVSIVLPMLQYSMNAAKSSDAPYSTPNQLRFTTIQSTILSAGRLLQQSNFDTSGEEEEEDSIVASTLLAGMIIGQLIGGYLGDSLGRQTAILIVMVLQIGGSIGSACITTSNSTSGLSALEQLAMWRFFLGLGAGGVYPLAAVMAAESKGSYNEGRNSPISAVDNDDDDDDNNNCHTTGHASESNRDDIESFRRIALTFSTQGLGFITVPLVAYILLELRCNVNFTWRFLLGIGGLPGFVVLILRLRQGRGINTREEVQQDETNFPDRDDGNKKKSNDENGNSEITVSGSVEMAPSTDNDYSPPPSLLLSDSHDSDTSNSALEEENDTELALVKHSYIESEIEATNLNELPVVSNQQGLWQSISKEPNLYRKLAGTAGTWFLFDVLFYGNTLFEPLVLEAAFGSRVGKDSYSLLQRTVRDSLVISLLSLPGYFVTVVVIGKRTCGCFSNRSSASPNRCGFPSCFPCYQTPKLIQMQGFLLMSTLYIIIGIFWVALSKMQWILLLLYASSFFFANYGPNTTTFLLPSVTYSKECRSTLNGISAAAGKIGAVLGSAAFAPAADELGESTVMILCGCVSFAALILTKVCVRGSSGGDL